MKQHILVVDDEPDVEILISQKFRREIRQGEYIFTFVYNGLQAYQKITEIPLLDIDMILTDINMPVMDGLALLEKLNALNNPPKTVVVSAYSDMDNIRTAMNNGAFDFLTKPIDLQDLVITLKKTLKAVAETKANQILLQDARFQNEKMAFLGNLIAGVAHEINNPTSFLQGNLQPAQNYVQDLLGLIDLYQKKVPSRDEEIEAEIELIDLDFIREDLPKLLKSMSVGIERISNISQSLRTFARTDQERKTIFNIQKGINGTLIILSHRLKANGQRPAIQIIKDYENIPNLQCFPGQLNQVFMNILANALDAFDKTNLGKTYSEIEANPNTIAIHTSQLKEGAIAIKIQDNGCGMDAETQERIFEQGFTTKEVGKGTGLGMTISQQIITEKHGGTITCLSELGVGTTFMITLPDNEST